MSEGKWSCEYDVGPGGDGFWEYYNIVNPGGRTVGRVFDKDDAEHVVRALNYYESFGHLVHTPQTTDIRPYGDWPMTRRTFLSRMTWALAAACLPLKLFRWKKPREEMVDLQIQYFADIAGIWMKEDGGDWKLLTVRRNPMEKLPIVNINGKDVA